MNLHDEARPLKFPVPFPNIPYWLVTIDLDREESLRAFGEPQKSDDSQGLGVTDLWAFEYPCGLQIVLQFFRQPGRGLLVVADSPEINHVLHHLPVPESRCQTISGESLENELQLLRNAYPERGPELDQLHSWQVWRQGDDGNRFKVGDPTSRRTAECLVSHFESLGHKQLYWSESV